MDRAGEDGRERSGVRQRELATGGGSSEDGRDPDVRRREIQYSPLPSQKRFHESDARFKGFSGPVGSGKSQALCQEALKLCYLNAGRTGLLGAPTYPMLRDATQLALFEVLEANRIGFEWNRAENYLVLRETKSRILFRSLEEFERLRGSNLAWFGVDELTYTAEEAWLRLEARLRDPKAKALRGFAVWTPKGYDWVYERFISSKVDGYDTIIAEPYENRFLLEKIPDYYERLKSSYTGRFFEQEVLGRYLDLHAGRVYFAFDRKENLREAVVNPAEPLLWALDFNVDPMSSVVAQRRGDQVCVIDEIMLSRATTRQACEEFATRFAGHLGGVRVYADATGARQQTTGASDHQVVKDYFRDGVFPDFKLCVGKSNPAVTDRLNLMNAKLLAADGERSLFVDPRCKELVKDLEQVSYKENSLILDKDRDPKRTHLSDALGYLVWQEFSGGGKVGERGQRIL